MGVFLRCGAFGVAQQLADDGQGRATTYAHAGKGMTQIVNSHFAQPSYLADAKPRLAQIDETLALFVANDHKGVLADPKQSFEG